MSVTNKTGKIVKPRGKLPETYFVPENVINKALEALENKQLLSSTSDCKRNLYLLQRPKLAPGSVNENNWSINFQYHNAIKRATLSHEWDKLLFLLKNWPYFDPANRSKSQLPNYDVYARAFTTLMLNHPQAHQQGLLMDYFHMVLGCRNDEDKKILMKLVVSLPNKLENRALKLNQENST